MTCILMTLGLVCRLGLLSGSGKLVGLLACREICWIRDTMGVQGVSNSLRLMSESGRTIAVGDVPRTRKDDHFL
jgi:hypothetical protein